MKKGQDWITAYSSVLSLSGNGCTSFWMECGSRCGTHCTRLLVLLFLLLISNLLVVNLLLVLIHLLVIIHRVQPSSHIPCSSVGSFGLTSTATCTASQNAAYLSALFLGVLPSCPRRTLHPFLGVTVRFSSTFFSLYDPDVSNTTLFPFLATIKTDPSALLTLATWKVNFPNCAPSANDMISVFSPSFSTALPSAVVWNTSRLDPSGSLDLWLRNHILGMTVSAEPLSTTNGCGMGVHSLAISHNGSLSTEVLSKITTRSGPSCVLLCLLTDFRSRPVLHLSPLHILHMTLVHHRRSRTSLCFCFVLSSCRDFAQRWPRTYGCIRTVHSLLWFGCTSTSPASSEFATPRASSSGLVFRFPFFFLHNSSTGLAHWCTHLSGPTRPTRSRFGVLSLFPFLSGPTSNLCQS